MKCIRIDESMLEGAVSCERGDGWIRPWRLNFAELPLYAPDEGLPLRAVMSAGVRLHIRTDSSSLGLRFLATEATRSFDLTIDNELLETQHVPAGTEELLFEDLPEGENTLELWLPMGQESHLVSLDIDDGATFEVPVDTRLRWITYGSSISHCGSAHSPARTWPATAARARNLNLTCLGYGGQCHLDPMVGRMIRDLPADLITLKLGINVQGSGSLNARTFPAAVIGLVKTIRERHPSIPIGLISPIISPPREETDNAVGLSLAKMRVIIADCVKRLQDCGDAKIAYFDGLELFGESLVEDYLPDLLHPNGDGYEIMGQNAAEQILDRLLL
ncbi:MAG: GDSL family lipase [Lentisphaeria bacterium]|nr:GDSL family lipase [Lentisphaeria bacterium]